MKSIFLWMLACLVQGRAEVKFEIPFEEKYVLIGFEYETEYFIPAPFVGVWFLEYYDPSIKSFREKNYSTSVSIQSDGDDRFKIKSTLRNVEGAGTTTFSLGLDDWTAGFYKEKTEREELINTKSLLDYNRHLPHLPEGQIPESISITKYKIGIKNGVTTNLVVFVSKDFDSLRKYCRIPLFMSRGYDEKTYFYVPYGARKNFESGSYFNEK